MKGKIIISAVSLILVVGVAIGVVVVVRKNGVDPEIETQQRNLRVICQNAEDQKVCHETLRSVSGTDPKAYIAFAVKAATENVIKAFNMSERLTTEYGKENKVKMALNFCTDMMQFALDSLELSNNCVHEKNIQGIHDQTADMRNWLSAVISYKQSCMEGFDDAIEVEKKIKEQLHVETLQNVQKVTVVALDIVTGLTNILEQFNLKFDLKPAASRRRLLNSEVNVDDDGYPSWVSAVDRKLLAKMKGKGWKGNPNVVVAKDGSGQFKTIKEAIASYPQGNKGRYVIYVKGGVYDEQNITIPKNAVNILMFGDGPDKTIITGKKSKADGFDIDVSPTFANNAIGFIGKGMKFENTAGPDGKQAVAFRNQGDMSALVGCHIAGYQDTLWVQANRQFYRGCEISGTIDFIFGTSATLIQDSKIIVRKPGQGQFNAITADGTENKSMNTGIVIQGCNIIPEAALYPQRFTIKSYLGRPWKSLAKTVIMESTIGDFIHPDGWTVWDTQTYHNTCYFAEYANNGPGANVTNRIRWNGYHRLISRAEATKFTARIWLEAGPISAPISAEKWLDGLRIYPYLDFKA